MLLSQQHDFFRSCSRIGSTYGRSLTCSRVKDDRRFGGFGRSGGQKLRVESHIDGGPETARLDNFANTSKHLQSVKWGMEAEEMVRKKQNFMCWTKSQLVVESTFKLFLEASIDQSTHSPQPICRLMKRAPQTITQVKQCAHCAFKLLHTVLN